MERHGSSDSWCISCGSLLDLRVVMKKGSSRKSWLPRTFAKNQKKTPPVRDRWGGVGLVCLSVAGSGGLVFLAASQSARVEQGSRWPAGFGVDGAVSNTSSTHGIGTKVRAVRTTHAPMVPVNAGCLVVHDQHPMTVCVNALGSRPGRPRWPSRSALLPKAPQTRR